jgi:hypothetical protein
MKQGKSRDSLPITEARNLGPVSSALLPPLGVHTIGDLRSLGWEEVALRVMNEHPRFVNLNMLRALIGAFHDRDFRDLPEDDLAKARQMIALFRNRT